MWDYFTQLFSRKFYTRGRRHKQIIHRVILKEEWRTISYSLAGHCTGLPANTVANCPPREFWIRNVDNRLYNNGTHLALLVSVCKYLETIGGDRQELHITALQQGDHLLQPSGQSDRHLGSLLMKQQIVKSCDRVKKNWLDARSKHTRTEVKVFIYLFFRHLLACIIMSISRWNMRIKVSHFVQI